MKFLLQARSNQNITIKVDSIADDSNLSEPIAANCCVKRNNFFNNKIIIENISNTPLYNFNIISNNIDLSNFISLSKFLKLNSIKEKAFYQLYNFWKDTILHKSSYHEENANPFYLLNYWQYGVCNDSANAFSSLLSHLKIPCKYNRNIHINGHSTYEYYINKSWGLVDVNLNMLFFKLDNKTLASYDDIIKDPFIVLRTKAFGKNDFYNYKKSWAYSSLFEHEFSIQHKMLSEKIEESVIKDSSDLTDKGWDLYPGEKIIYHYDECPEHIIDKRCDSINIEPEKKFKTGKIELLINTRIRRNIEKKNEIIVRTKYPIYRINNQKTGQNILVKEKIITQIKINNTFQDNVTVCCSGSKETFPVLHKGLNQLSIFNKENKGEVTVKFLLNDQVFKGISTLPFVKIINLPFIFKYSNPYFILSYSEKIEKIWFQISETNDFKIIIPNLERIQNVSKRIALSEISNTFLSNNNTYYIRIKAKENEIWGEWSHSYSFKVIKPASPRHIIITKINDRLIKLTWYTTDQDSTFFIFGSNRLDFIPDFYCSEEVIEVKNFEPVKIIHNKNFIGQTDKNFFIAENSYCFYRIIAKKEQSYSIPSQLVVSNLATINNDKPKALQSRHFCVSDNSFFGFQDIYEGDVIDIKHEINDYALLKNAIILLKANNYEYAESLLTKLEGTGNKSPILYICLHIVYRKQKNNEKYLFYLQIAKNISGSISTYVINVSKTLCILGSKEEAKNLCKFFFKNNSDNEDVINHLKTLDNISLDINLEDMLV